LGIGIISATLILALLIAWRLPLNRTLPLDRTVGGSSSSWGSYGGAPGAGRAYEDDHSRNYALSEQPGEELGEREGTSVGSESASSEETSPGSADERVAGASGTTEAREASEAEDAPADVPQGEHLRLVEETPTEGQEQQHQLRRAGGGR
jgi:hypothetical protein